jgi:signal transduction histidine kinase
MEKMLERINKSALKFLSTNSIEETYKIIVNEAIKLTGAEYGSIILEQDGSLNKVYSSNDNGYKILSRKKGNTYKAFTEGKILQVHVSQIQDAHPQAIDIGIKWTLFIPLTYQKKSLGVITVNTMKNDKFDQRQLNLLKLYGSLASLAIQNVQNFIETKNALETRDLFIGLASHELKTPLTAINGYIQLLNKKSYNYDPKQTKWLESLKNESYRLTGLVKELLEINQIKTGQFQFNFRECNLLQLLNKSIEIMNVSHPQRKIVTEIKIKSEPMICADEDKIVQLVINILRNAAKFSPANTPIEVRLSEGPTFYSIEVEDHGIGIEKKDLPKVFDGYYRGANANREGMGLGLFLSKHIVEGHKGKISVSSEVGLKTIITVKLPKIV